MYHLPATRPPVHCSGQECRWTQPFSSIYCTGTALQLHLCHPLFSYSVFLSTEFLHKLNICKPTQSRATSCNQIMHLGFTLTYANKLYETCRNCKHSTCNRYVETCHMDWTHQNSVKFQWCTQDAISSQTENANWNICVFLPKEKFFLK